MRVVHEAKHLDEALAAARREAQQAFGDARVFLEKYIEAARHVEFQILADQYGQIVHLFERDCSAQRRPQTIVEESPSPLLDDNLRAFMGQAAVEAARAVNYVNAGTVEFIATPQGEFYFLEMNTRLQVEHPVTEWVTGLDLVKLQFAIAAGEALPFSQDELSQSGHAIECRLYAEDPQQDFLPAAGPLLRFRPPEGPGIRVDAGYASGDVISPYYDPLIAKLIVYDRDRESALRRMQQALAETVLLGTGSNLALLRALLAHPAFAAGTIDTGFVESHLAELLPEAAPLPDAALIVAALHDSATINSIKDHDDSDDPWARPDGFRLGGSDKGDDHA
jgi:3-methylcrotonyl-CoA carboxylase alpha subunit